MVVDPLVAFLGSKTNSFKDADVRRALAPLAAVAEVTGAAIVGVRHLSKAMGMSHIYRGGGSIAFSGAARSVSMVGKDPEAEDARVLASVKSNLGPAPDALRFRLVSAGEVARVEWLGGCGITAEQLCTQPQGAEERSALDEAVDFLREELAGGPQQAANVRTAANETGIALVTLKRAKSRLKVSSRREGGPGATGRWVWELPEPLRVSLE